MSIEVSIERLGAEVAGWGTGYLVSVSDDGRPHLLALRPEVIEGDDGPTLRCEVGGGRAGRNAAARPAVTLLFPPTDRSDGMSLLVDGHATVAGATIDVRPTSAVLHRPAP